MLGRSIWKLFGYPRFVDLNNSQVWIRDERSRSRGRSWRFLATYHPIKPLIISINCHIFGLYPEQKSSIIFNYQLFVIPTHFCLGPRCAFIDFWSSSLPRWTRWSKLMDIFQLVQPTTSSVQLILGWIWQAAKCFPTTPFHCDRTSIVVELLRGCRLAAKRMKI